MDYADLAAITRHDNYAAFRHYAAKRESRIILMTTKAALPYAGFRFRGSDIILMGRESSGVPDHVHEEADAALTIPMVEGARSINQAVSAAMVLGEALRQCNLLGK